MQPMLGHIEYERIIVLSCEQVLGEESRLIFNVSVHKHIVPRVRKHPA